MSITLTGTITGGAQTGLTSPTFTSTTDQAMDLRSKQAYISALGGTQTGAVAHSVNAPFTITCRRPSLLKTLSTAFLNGVTGQYSRVPFNDYLILVRKSAQIAANQWYTNEFRFLAHIAAGSETYDIVNVRSGLSCMIGLLNGQSAGIGDTLNTGTLG